MVPIKHSLSAFTLFIVPIIALHLGEDYAGQLCNSSLPCREMCNSVSKRHASLCKNTTNKCLGECPLLTCLKVNGSCIHLCDSNTTTCDCLRSLTNESCEHLCAGVCSEESCLNVTLECIECSRGYYGDRCDQICSLKCNISCFKDTGYCKSCSHGYYGRWCELECPQHCYNKICSTEDATCLGCAEGFKGNTCEDVCPKGYHGLNCRSPCSETCTRGQCHAVSGTCIAGCRPGYYGATCEKTCPNGTYGEGCLSQCPVTCAEHTTCHHVTGKCLQGCSSGFEGSSCNVMCSYGTYGKDCSENCSDNCFLRLCNPFSGHCQRCKRGLEGLFCENVDVTAASSFESSEITTNQTVLMFLGLFAMGVIVWVLLGALMYHRRKLMLRKIEETGKIPAQWAAALYRYRKMGNLSNSRQTRESTRRQKRKLGGEKNRRSRDRAAKRGRFSIRTQVNRGTTPRTASSGSEISPSNSRQKSKLRKAAKLNNQLDDMVVPADGGYLTEKPGAPQPKVTEGVLVAIDAGYMSEKRDAPPTTEVDENVLLDKQRSKEYTEEAPVVDHFVESISEGVKESQELDSCLSFSDEIKNTVTISRRAMNIPTNLRHSFATHVREKARQPPTTILPSDNFRQNGYEQSCASSTKTCTLNQGTRSIKPCSVCEQQISSAVGKSSAICSESCICSIRALQGSKATPKITETSSEKTSLDDRRYKSSSVYDTLLFDLPKPKAAMCTSRQKIPEMPTLHSKKIKKTSVVSPKLRRKTTAAKHVHSKNAAKVPKTTRKSKRKAADIITEISPTSDSVSVSVPSVAADEDSRIQESNKGSTSSSSSEEDTERSSSESADTTTKETPARVSNRKGQGDISVDAALQQNLRLALIRQSQSPVAKKQSWHTLAPSLEKKPGRDTQGDLGKGYRGIVNAMKRLIAPSAQKMEVQGSKEVIWRDSLPQKRHASFQFLLARLETWRRAGGFDHNITDGVIEISAKSYNQSLNDSDSNDYTSSENYDPEAAKDVKPVSLNVARSRSLMTKTKRKIPSSGATSVRNFSTSSNDSKSDKPLSGQDYTSNISTSVADSSEVNSSKSSRASNRRSEKDKTNIHDYPSQRKRSEKSTMKQEKSFKPKITNVDSHQRVSSVMKYTKDEMFKFESSAPSSSSESMSSSSHASKMTSTADFSDTEYSGMETLTSE